MKQAAAGKTICLLTAVLLVFTAGCAVNAEKASPKESGDTAAASDFTLSDKGNAGGQGFTLGVQPGAYPWGKSGLDEPAFYVRTEPPGVKHYSVSGPEISLYYTADEETGVQTLRSLQTIDSSYETPRGVRRGDTLNDLLAAYDEGLLYQPEPGTVRGDFGVCRYVFDEIFIYTGADGPCIIFYIVDDIEKKWISCVEMRLGADDRAGFSADNVTTFQVDYSNISKLLATDTETEETLHSLLKGAQTDAKSVFEALPDINWRLYGLLYEDASALLDWLYLLEITDEADIAAVMNATHGLDGGLAEGYSGVVGRLFMSGPEKFIECLALLDPDQADAVAGDVAYDCGYGRREEAKAAVAQTRALLEAGTLTEAGKAAARRLLDAMDSGAG